jgi:hypothetical protein
MTDYAVMVTSLSEIIRTSFCGANNNEVDNSGIKLDTNYF